MQLLHIIAILFNSNFIVHTANFIFFDNLSKKLIVIKCEIKTIKKKKTGSKVFLTVVKVREFFCLKKIARKKYIKPNKTPKKNKNFVDNLILCQNH